MPTLTTYNTTNFGQVEYNVYTTCSLAKTTAATWAQSGNAMGIGLTYSAGGPGWRYRESFFEFDTSSIPENARIISATLSIVVRKGTKATQPIIYIGDHNWGAAVDASDKVFWATRPTTVGSKSLGSVTTGVRFTLFDGTSQLKDAIVKNGTTKLVAYDGDLDPADTTNCTTSVSAEYIYDGSVFGTSTDRPQLIVTYEEYGSGMMGANF